MLPYWREAALIAADHGIVLCVEPHSADVVYNTPTFRRLRDEIGPEICMNFDPSHLWWQGMDPIAVVEEVGRDIRTCHVKDAHLDRRRIERDGVASPLAYERWDERPWTFSTPGLRPLGAVLGAARDRPQAGGLRAALSASSARTRSSRPTTRSPRRSSCWSACCPAAIRRRWTGRRAWRSSRR